MSQEERALLLDKHVVEIGISKVARITNYGEFFPEGGAAEIDQQALKRYCTQYGKEVLFFV